MTQIIFNNEGMLHIVCMLSALHNETNAFIIHLSNGILNDSMYLRVA